MAAARPSPDAPALQQAQLALINKALYRLNQAVSQMDTAERAGVDVSALRDMHAEVLAALTTLKQQYFPGSS